MVFFNSLAQILAQIEQQPEWTEYRQYRQLLECWGKIVNPTTAKYTKPLYIKRQILWVATSSAARAQELSFQRYALLKQLNAQLSFALTDIRFSSSQWQKVTSTKATSNNLIKVKHREDSENNLKYQQKSPNYGNILKKSVTHDPLASSKLSSPQDAQTACQNWWQLRQKRMQSLPLCSQCKVPTPPTELERWNLCHHCVAKKWSTEYRSPTFINKD